MNRNILVWTLVVVFSLVCWWLFLRSVVESYGR